MIDLLLFYKLLLILEQKEKNILLFKWGVSYPEW